MATLILKATEKCNSNCYYCDVVRKEHTGASMSLDILEKLFMRVNEYLLAKPKERADILWHGGEPLLLGPQYYWSAVDLQDRYCADTKDRIHHSIQTNLTCFTEKFVEVFRRLGITSVGTSFDPEPHMRGPGKEIDSELYNRMFMDAISVLECNGFGWGMIYVVTKKSLVRPLDVFYYLTNLKLTGGCNLNPVLIYDYARKDVAITPAEYVEFLGAIFPTWWKYRHRFPDIQPFRSLVSNIMEGSRDLGCVESGGCAYHHVNIAPDGTTSQCGRSADWGLLDFGSILERPLADILQDSKRDQLDERNLLLQNTECKGCRFWEICHGGCPLDAYSQHKSFMHKSEWCESRRGFISRYFEPITGVRFEPHNR